MDHSAEPPPNHGVDLQDLIREKTPLTLAELFARIGVKNNVYGPVTPLRKFDGEVLTGAEPIRSLMVATGALPASAIPRPDGSAQGLNN